MLLEAANHAQELQFALGGEAVAALDFDGAGAQSHRFVETLQGHVVELVLRSRCRSLGRVEDAAAAFGNLLVAEAADLVNKLMLARVGIDEVGVRVAERREKQTSRSIVLIVKIQSSEFKIRIVKIRHRSEGFDFLVLNDEVCVVKCFKLSHLLALKAHTVRAVDADYLLDVLYEC